MGMSRSYQIVSSVVCAILTIRFRSHKHCLLHLSSRTRRYILLNVVLDPHLAIQSTMYHARVCNSLSFPVWLWHDHDTPDFFFLFSSVRWRIWSVQHCQIVVRGTSPSSQLNHSQHSRSDSWLRVDDWMILLNVCRSHVQVMWFSLLFLFTIPVINPDDISCIFLFTRLIYQWLWSSFFEICTYQRYHHWR